MLLSILMWGLVGMFPVLVVIGIVTAGIWHRTENDAVRRRCEKIMSGLGGAAIAHELWQWRQGFEEADDEPKKHDVSENHYFVAG